MTYIKLQLSASVIVFVIMQASIQIYVRNTMPATSKSNLIGHRLLIGIRTTRPKVQIIAFAIASDGLFGGAHLPWLSIAIAPSPNKSHSSVARGKRVAVYIALVVSIQSVAHCLPIPANINNSTSSGGKAPAPCSRVRIQTQARSYESYSCIIHSATLLQRETGNKELICWLFCNALVSDSHQYSCRRHVMRNRTTSFVVENQGNGNLINQYGDSGPIDCMVAI